MLFSLFFLTGCNSQKASNSNSKENYSDNTTTYTSTSKTLSKDKNEASTNLENSNTVDSAPYAVNINSIDNALTFNFKGMNVSTSVTLEKSEPMNIVTFRTKLLGSEKNELQEAVNQYEVSINVIPTKEIRIFSSGNNVIRTVKVNTELVLGKKISSNYEQNLPGNLYLFNNKNGSISLITPNYAGNVTDEQKDVMLEVTP